MKIRITESLHCDEGAFHSFKKACEIFPEQCIFYESLVNFLQNKRILSKFVRYLWEQNAPRIVNCLVLLSLA